MPLDYQNELFIQVDEQDRVIGKITRGEAHHNHQIIHRAVQVVITNSQNQVLLQKRSPKKDKHPNIWGTSAGGHVSWGQTYQEAAQRELQEEIGLDVPLEFIKKILTDSGDEREVNAIFIGQYQGLPTNLDPDEVDEVRWIDVDHLTDFAQKNHLTPIAYKTLKVLGYQV